MITPSPRWSGTVIAAILAVPLLAVVLLSAPTWLAWPFLNADRRTGVLDFLNGLVEWARVLRGSEVVIFPTAKSGAQAPRRHTPWVELDIVLMSTILTIEEARLVPEIAVSDRGLRELKIIAGVKGLSSAGEAVDYLLDAFQDTVAQGSDVVSIYARYKGRRVEGQFSLSTSEVTITTGPLAGVSGAPSTTAGKVIKSINPDGSKYCNGWLHFWKTADGKPIDVYRHR